MLQFFVQLVSSPESVELVNFVNVVLGWVDILTGSVSLIDLEAPLLGVTVFDEDTIVLARFLIDIEGSRGPPEQETWSLLIVATSILNFISMHPSKTGEVFALLIEATVVAHLLYLGFIYMPLGCIVLSYI